MRLSIYVVFMSTYMVISHGGVKKQATWANSGLEKGTLGSTIGGPYWFLNLLLYL